MSAFVTFLALLCWLNVLVLLQLFCLFREIISDFRFFCRMRDYYFFGNGPFRIEPFWPWTVSACMISARFVSVVDRSGLIRWVVSVKDSNQPIMV